MANLSLFSTQEYQVAVKLYDYMMSELRTSMRQEVKKEAILRETAQKEQDVYGALKEGYADLRDTIDKKKAALKERHSKTEYDDPAAELLRRQDVDMRLKTMTDLEFSAYISELEPGSLTEYEYNAYSIRARQMQNESQTDRAVWKLAELARAADFRKPWEKDPEWVSLQQLEDEMRLARADTLWHPTEDGGDYKPVDISGQIKEILRGY